MSSHPTDRELSAFLAGSLDETLRSHIDDCAYCRSRLHTAGPVIDIPARFAVEFRHIELPTPTIDAIPERGDIWRLAWEDIRELAVVLGSTDGGIVVAPLVDDPNEVADEWTVLFDVDASSLGISFGVGVAHPYTLPIFVFDARLAQLEAELVSIIDDASSAYRSGQRPAAPTGPPLHGPLDPRIDALGEITDEFDALVGASWVEPTVEGETTDWLAFGDLGLVDTYRLYELSSGAPPEPHEVAAAFERGLRIGAPGFNESLVSFLDLPRNSTRLRRRAAQQRRRETDVRLEAATSLTNQQFALAARGGDGSVDWDPLLGEYLDETGD